MWLDILITDWARHFALGFLVALILAYLTLIMCGHLYSKYRTRYRSLGYRDAPYIILVFSWFTAYFLLLSWLHLYLDGMI